MPLQVEVKGVTRMWASGHLRHSFDGIGLVWLSQEVKPKEDLVMLRDFNNLEGKSKTARGAKVVLEVPETSEVNDYRARLHEYNSFLVRHCVALAVNDDQLSTIAQRMQGKDESDVTKALNLSSVQLRRMFSRGSMQKGGRFFGGWWQGVPSLYRPHIIIDGYQTVEIDYSSMALRIIYARRGHQVPEDVDLYDIGLDNWEGPLDKRRKPIKTYINAILNDESGRYRLTKDELEILGVTQKILHQKLLERHEAISDLFNTGIGMDTQFIESNIASLVISKMLYEGILGQQHRLTLKDHGGEVTLVKRHQRRT